MSVVAEVAVAEETQSWPPFSWELSHKSSETEESFFFFFFKREKVLERVVFVTTVTCVCSGTICSRSRAFFFLVFVVSVSEREREGMRDLYMGLYGQ